MHRQTHRILVQSFSLLNALFLAFQPLLAIPLVLSTPVAVQAESVLDPDSVNLSFDHTTHEFELLVKTDQSLPYVLTYVDESQDPVMEQATTGQLEEIEAGVYGDTIYAGSCSGDVCTPNVVNSGVLQIGDQLKMEYRIVDGRVVMGGSSTEEIECIAPDTERLTSGDTLWDVDEEQQLAETNSAVTLGAVYQFPLDDKISVTFTCLPKDESARTSLKIQQIAVEELALPDTVKTDSQYAYDITTNMENGSFQYELTLPKEEGVEVEVQYIEKSLDEAKQEVKADDVKLVEPNETVNIKQDAEKKDVTVSGLDHFTIFVVVPSDIVTSNLNLVSFLQQGWRMTSTGNANIALVDIASESVPAGFGPHVIRTNRTGGTGNNRAYLGYYQPDLRLNQIESIKWNRYTKTGDDTYLNIYLRHPSNPLVTATVVAHPAITVGKWEQEVFDNSTTTGLTIRQGGTTNTITYAQLMSNYGNWLVRNDAFCKVSGWSCLNPANNVQIGGIVFVSGSSSPTAPQEHYYDGVTLDFTNQDPAYYNFVQTTPQLAAPENLGWNTRSGSSNPYDRPVDVECGGTTDADFPTYSNGQVAHNWSTDDTDSQLRFQRQWRWPGSGVWTTDPTIYSATNTTFATFGSDVGTEGTWNTRVRSWLDQNGNAVFDEGIDVVSEWSNECAVTYDRTMTSDVTVCKEDSSNTPLANWQVGLSQPIGFDEQIPVTSVAGTNATLPENGDYVVYASGTYRYGSSAMVADAGFSFRPVGIPYGTGGWVSGDDLLSVPGALKLKVGGQNIQWGGFTTGHQYATYLTGMTAGLLNLSIWDDHYGDNDNNGNFRASIDKQKFVGQTGQNGCVTFSNVPYGNYHVFEAPQKDWAYQSTTVGSEVVTAYPATVSVGVQVPTITLTNKLVDGDVSVYKYKDLNTNGTYDADEPLLNGWKMVLASSSGELEQSTGDKGILGNTVFRVPGGTYTLSENMWEGWYQSAISCDSDPVEPTVTPAVTVYPSPSICPENGCASVDEPNWLDKILGVGIAFAEEVENEIAPNSKTVVVEAGKTTTCYVGNYQPSTIQGVKYFDANQDGTYDEGESKLPYWGISLTGPGVDQQVVTDENGAFSFNKLKAGTYTLCEENRTAWGWQVTEPAEPINTVCREVVIDRSGEIETHNFGNFIDSRLYIMKANNAWPTDQSVGTEVTYTIRVMAMGGPVTAAEVFDLPPQPFTYVPGSYTAESTKRGDLKGTTTTEPTYASPGVWQLGNLVKDEIVTLTYKAKIGSADPGIYPDMVWATGTSEQALAQGQTEGDLLALSNPALNESIGGVNFDGSQGHFGEDNFAGTQVAVVVDQTPSADHQVAVEVKETGSVLGASTELPATGGRFWISLIAILSVLVGGVMIYLGQKNRSATLTVALLVGLGLMMAPSAQAMTAVRIEQPYNTSTQLNQNASTNQRDMRVDFVVMNTAGLSVTAQCQQNKDGNGWSDITTQYVVKAGGNSGYCEAKNLGNQSNYDFRVRVTGDGADQYSATVRVGLDTNRPGTPINYGKFKGNDCEDVIKFRTADDNRTVRVDVYRSDNAEKFTANKDSRASQIPIGPKTDYTLTTSKPDCQKTYFYAVRAFDVNGNGSGLVGDENLTKVVVEGESEQAQTPTVGAVPVSNASGGSTTNLLTDQSLGGAGITESVVNDEGEEVRAEDEDADQTTSEEAGLEDTTEETESGAVLGESTGGGFFGWLGSLWQGFWGWLASLFGLN